MATCRRNARHCMNPSSAPASALANIQLRQKLRPIEVFSSVMLLLLADTIAFVNAYSLSRAARVGMRPALDSDREHPISLVGNMSRLFYDESRNTNNGLAVHPLKGNGNSFWSVAFAPDSGILAAGAVVRRITGE